ncbi:MAG: M42 family metallopeptidase [Thermoclostridium sp.]|nr:M42 family metallopeptidase [Thermoclostridium sp.]
MINKLMELTRLDGISGDEQVVRQAILEEIKNEELKYQTDSIGNLIVNAKTTGEYHFRVMLSAHMDEVGFMINGITDDGKLKFATVGGMDPRILIGQQVRVGTRKTPGVIGYKSIHLQDKAERESVVKVKNLYIDIGVKDREQAEALAALGDCVAFASEPVLFGKTRLKAKALDDRVGCAIILELVKQVWPFELVACFTVQEEVGLRGARVAANRVQPDVAVILEGTTCADVPGVKEHEVSTALGRGPAISFADRTSIGDRELIDHFVKTAQAEGIPYQWKQTVSGGNDAGRIQTSGKGVRVISVSAPCRYIHSPVSCLDTNDVENMLKLVQAALIKLPLLLQGRNEG